MTSAAIRSQAKSPFTPFQRDLPRIPELVPVASSRTRDTYAMTVREGMAEILPGFQTPIYGYDGVYPGPIIRAKKGREVVVRQTNGLPFETNVHLHGGYVPAAHDGHPMDVIPAGGHFDYHYPNDQDAATLWYHDHAHGRTSKTLYYGLVSMYLLEDDLETELGLPQGEFDVPLVLADHAFNKDGSFRYAENVDIGFRGDTLLVNGAISPRMSVQRRKYRLRFLNASNARSYTLRLGNGRPMMQIAGDGGLLSRPVPRTNIPMHPAERVDIVLDFSAVRAGRGARPLQHRRRGRHRAGHALRHRGRACQRGVPGPDPAARSRAASRSRTRGAAGSSRSAPPRGRSTGSASTRTASTRKPRLGSTEIWTFVNNSNRVHPMHLHGFLFRMLERSSGPVALADRLGWKDTVGVLPNETVSVLAWFAPYRGKYVFHCHSLEHADKAMMLQMEIV